MNPVRIKICGLTRVEDVRAAAELGADLLGFNLFPESPRYVAPDRLRPLLDAVPSPVEAVGLFVNRPLGEVLLTVAKLGGLRTVQWHGDYLEACEPCAYRFVPAFPVKDAESLTRLRHYVEACRGLNRLPAAVLVDAHAPGLYGGTGQTAPWDLLRDFDPGVPLILAGGLTPDNVAEAVRVVRPYAVDVASGVESAPGVKDVEKMKRFIEQARAA